MLMSSAAMATVASAASATTRASMRRDAGAGFSGMSVMIVSCKNGLRDGGGGLGVSDGEMAAGALESCGLAVNDVAVDGGGDALVAVAAGILGDLVIELRDLDGVGIPAGGEVERVPEAVVRLDGVFSENVVGRMTVVAGGGRVMARLQPGIVLRAHDVAIGAGGRVVGEIGVSLGVDECKEAEAEEEAEGNAYE